MHNANHSICYETYHKACISNKNSCKRVLTSRCMTECANWVNRPILTQTRSFDPFLPQTSCQCSSHRRCPPPTPKYIQHQDKLIHTCPVPNRHLWPPESALEVHGCCLPSPPNFSTITAPNTAIPIGFCFSLHCAPIVTHRASSRRRNRQITGGERIAHEGRNRRGLFVI